MAAAASPPVTAITSTFIGQSPLPFMETPESNKERMAHLAAVLKQLSYGSSISLSPGQLTR